MARISARRRGVNRRGNGPPDRRARGTPWFVTDRGGSAGLGEAGLGCAAGASADRRGAVVVRSGAVLEAPTLIAGLDDVAVMGEAVEERGRHLRIAEDAWPFAEGEVCRDDDRGALVETADEVEQQLPAGLREGEIAEFVEDHEVEAREIIGKPSLAACTTLGLELIDEIDGGEEAPARSSADATPRDGDGQMRLACAGRGSDMAPGFWRAKRRSTTPFIRWRAGRWPRPADASCSAATCI